MGQRRRHRAFVRGLDVGLPELMAERGCVPGGLRARVREHVGDRVQLEGVPGQHDRVLSLPDGAPRVQPCDRDGPSPARPRGRWALLDPPSHPVPRGCGARHHLRAPPPEGTWYYFYNWVFPTTYLQHSGRGFDVGTVQVLDVDRIRFRHLCFLPPDLDDATRRRASAVSMPTRRSVRTSTSAPGCSDHTLPTSPRPERSCRRTRCSSPTSTASSST